MSDPGRTVRATVANLQPQIEYLLYGAVTAAQAVLPAMRETGAGTLLFTSGGGSVDPVPILGNVNAAGAALRNWVINLNKELKGSGVHATHVAINVWIGDGGPEGFPTATSDEIAPPVLGPARKPRPPRSRLQRLNRQAHPTPGEGAPRPRLPRPPRGFRTRWRARRPPTSPPCWPRRPRPDWPW
ncbi:hypothetical protein ACF1HJ_43250 [Streptomyces sp. NPDC013978]|uniref:hypothetical protein n=1 Tax=Streptomyces sp. NPDC013978 TaxID=3364869 RepID=UPI0036F6B445